MMPPGFEPPTPEVIEQMRRVREAEEAAYIAQREDIMAWPMIFCTCSEGWLISPLGPGRAGQPPQVGCLVHGTVMVTRDGRVL